ncbi:MAG: type II toxin-antitoxin system death-on-curing family toxin [Chloroflexi bacterium]|nr:type II toxin-antitoxin system death-on-curing family toxin [Chloroflexota bacterium]
MPTADRDFIYLTIQQICEMNRQLIGRFGGAQFIAPDNLRNSATIEIALDTIEHGVFGDQQFDTVPKKAAKLGWEIIHNHPFNDTNKRTGAISVRALIRLNGHRIAATDDDVVELINNTAAGSIDYEQFESWWIDHCEEEAQNSGSVI